MKQYVNDIPSPKSYLYKKKVNSNNPYIYGHEAQEVIYGGVSMPGNFPLSSFSISLIPPLGAN